MNTYKALRDFGVQDESSPIYGSHVAGSEVNLEADVAAAYVENGDLELVSADAGVAQAPSGEDGAVGQTGAEIAKPEEVEQA